MGLKEKIFFAKCLRIKKFGLCDWKISALQVQLDLKKNDTEKKKKVENNLK